MWAKTSSIILKGNDFCYVICLQCSATCGHAKKHRDIWCQNDADQRLPDEHCSNENKPISYMKCNLTECPTWFHGAWGPVHIFIFLSFLSVIFLSFFFTISVISTYGCKECIKKKHSCKNKEHKARKNFNNCIGNKWVKSPYSWVCKNMLIWN